MHLCGKPLVSKGASDFRRELSYSPQADALWPRLALLEQLEVFARLRGLSREGARRVLETAMAALKIDEFANRRFIDLSGGTKRKVFLKIEFSLQYSLRLFK